MEITVSRRHNIFKLIITTFDTKIEEHIASGSPSKVDVELMEQCFSAGFEMSRYNGRSDVETIIMLINAFANDSEREQITQYLLGNKD